MKNQLAYIDEFGNFGFSFDKPNVSSHFIITAVIIDDFNLDYLNTELEKIRKTYFGPSEIRSNKVGKDDDRRLKILEEIILLPFHVYSFVIDKRILYGQGLKIKRSFYKFLNGMVDSNLFNAFPDIKIIADEIGDSEFMDSFEKYIYKNHIPDLFDNYSFSFEKSKTTLLIQLADFVTGTIAKYFDDSVYSEKGHAFLDILRNKIIGLVEWPKNLKPYEIRYEPSKISKYDESIASHSELLATSFIAKNENADTPIILDQVNCLKILLFNLKYINYSQYVPTQEIIKNLEDRRLGKIKQHYFRSKVIAKLRDKGVLISSCRSGYKIPVNSDDLYTYAAHTNQYVQPMLSRLKKCRDQILLTTKNELDILDYKEFTKYKIFFDADK